MTKVDQLKDRLIEMIDGGCTRFGWTIGPKWHELTIEQKAAAILEMLDARKDAVGAPSSGVKQRPVADIVAEANARRVR